MKRIWDRVRPHLDHLDLAVAAILGVGFTVLGVVGAANGDTLSQAAIGLLALLAFSILRERLGRTRVEKGLTRLETSLKEAVRRVEQVVDEMDNDSAYHTRSLELTYDLIAPDGSHAQATKRRRIRFIRNNVLSITEHHKADGDSADDEIVGGPPDGPAKTLPRVSKMKDELGRAIDLISLQRPWKRGEVMEVVSKRTLRNSFLDGHEYVSFFVDAPTDEVVFDITWPQGAPPQKLDVARNGGASNDQAAVSLERLSETEDGRQRLVEKITDPAVGEKIALFWEWEPGNAN